MAYDDYDNPLIGRYASPEMSRLWGPQRKFTTWRKLWVALAEAERELGLPIEQSQIDELRAHIDDIDFDAARRHERRIRHDVMAHVHTYGDACPNARGIIHLGATSCYVTDNTDLLLMREGLQLVRERLVSVIDQLGKFAHRYRDMACLGFTHMQPAQPTTVGKRACLWAYDLVLDLEDIVAREESLQARGVKGTTGTQASFLELFKGNHQKVRELDRLVAQKMGFAETLPVTGQTYTRKIDSRVIDALSGIGQSAHKIATDIRLLASRKELEEPIEADQIGSSAMAYKRNPMRSERICSLGRFVMSLQSSSAQTVAVQWMERTLDDSANRRLVIPQAFLAIDAILILLQNVTAGMVVYPQMIAKYLREELPFMATENLMMAAVKAGGDRQELHERIRVHSRAAASVVKQEGKSNDLIDRLAADPAFRGIDLASAMNPALYVGRAPEQVDEFVAEVIQPIRDRFPNSCGLSSELRV